MVNIFGMTYRSFKVHSSLNFSNFVILLLSFSYCLTIALKWYTSFKCTIESRYLCYYVTSIKKLKLEKVFSEKKIVAVSLKKTVIYTHILNTCLFHKMKSFKHEHHKIFA